MKQTDLAVRLAGKSKISPGEAADQIDRIVHRIKKRIRRGKPAALPGLGRFKPGATPEFEFQRRGGAIAEQKRQPPG